jgi:methionyl-tRNA formyltransferase
MINFSGMINVHASLLPKYRGASPIIHAIRNGDKETGVSIMRIRPRKFDIGEVLMAQRIQIPDDILMPHLNDHLANIGAELLVECIKDLNQYEPIEQDSSAVSYGMQPV